jgi:hypothetical protein
VQAPPPKGLPVPVAPSNLIFGGICVRQIDQFNSGFCLLVGLGLINNNTTPVWVLQAGTIGIRMTLGTFIANGTLDSSFSLTAYQRLALSVYGQQLTAWVNGEQLCSLRSPVKSTPPVGLASLMTGQHYAQFDNLAITGKDSGAFPSSLFSKHLLWPSTPYPGGNPQPAAARSDFTGLAGCAITIGDTPLTVIGLGRFSAGFVSNDVHNLSIFTNTGSLVAQVAVDLSAVPGDLNGYSWAMLASAVELQAGQQYYVVSSEVAGSDVFYDSNSAFVCACLYVCVTILHVLLTRK